MAYCTRQDLVDRIGEDLLTEISDLERHGQVGEDRVTQAIDAASAEIDSYAMQRYPVPFSPVPAMVKQTAVTIAVFKLFASHGFATESADKVHADAYKAAVDWLKLLGKGQVSIGVLQPPKDLGASVQANERVFTRGKMEGF